MFSSIGPTGPETAVAPRSTASFSALAASFTRKAMALAEGPWTLRNSAGWPEGSMLRMKLMSPWRNRSTFFERCLDTAVKPISSNRPFSRSGSGEVNSTNSKPSVPSGFSKRSRPCGFTSTVIVESPDGRDFVSLETSYR